MPQPAAPEKPATETAPAKSSPSSEWNDEYDLDPDDYVELKEWREAHTSRPEAAKPETAKAEAAPASEPVRVAHPASLVSRARSLGVAAAEIESMSTADLRAEVQQALDFQRHEFARQRADESRRQPARQPEKPTAEPEPAKSDPLTELEAEGFDPKLIAYLRAESERAKRLDGLESRFNEFHQREMARESVQTQREMDRLFAKHAAVFGEKPTRLLAPDDPGLVKRRVVYGQLQQMAQEGRLTDLEDDFEAVRRAVFGEAAGPPTLTAALADAGATPPAEPANGEQPKDPKTGRFVKAANADAEAERKKEWMAGTLLAPTERRDAELPDGEEKALKNLAARMRSRGLKVDGD